MFQQCEDCHRRYDDEYSNTMCPHYPLGTSPETYCRRHDLFRPCTGCEVVAEQLEESQGKRGLWVLGALMTIAAFWVFVIGWVWTGRIGWFLSWR